MAREIRELLCRLGRAAADMPHDVDVKAVLDEVRLELRDAEIGSVACAPGGECYGSAAVWLAPREALAVAARLAEAALALGERETAAAGAPAAAYLIDLYWIRPARDSAGLEIRRVTNEPGRPVLLLLRGGDREYVIESHAIIGAVDTYAGLDHYSRRLRELFERDGGRADAVIAGHGMRPFCRP